MKQEEKAKRYDEAVKRAMSIYNDESSSCEAEIVCENIFPELIESEDKDEKIRKALIDFFNKGAENEAQTNGVCDKDIITWLEKQKSVEEIVERCKNSWYNEGKIQGQIEGLMDEEKYQQGWHDALEKQGEQKPLDIDIDSMVASYKKRVIEKSNGYADSPLVDMCLTAFRRGIENALDELNVRYFVNKNEQKPAWSEEDEEILRTIISDGIRGAEFDMLQIDWLKSLKDRVGCEANCTTTKEWSEEDEKNFARVDYACLKVYGGDSYSSDWLRKFLGIHKKWKPSEEQMDALNDVIIYVKDSMFPSKNVLKKLYEQLKKIRKE